MNKHKLSRKVEKEQHEYKKTKKEREEKWLIIYI